jgi:hypothetical protein
MADTCEMVDLSDLCDCVAGDKTGVFTLLFTLLPAPDPRPRPSTDPASRLRLLPSDDSTESCRLRVPLPESDSWREPAKGEPQSEL